MRKQKNPSSSFHATAKKPLQILDGSVLLFCLNIVTEEEFEVMKQHTPAGGEIILHSLQDFSNAEFRKIAYEVARYHHEKYNGKGYPEGLSKEEIPLHARIMAVADVFYAVSQRRCYRGAWPAEEFFSIIERGSGVDFDPDIAKIFLSSRNEVIGLMQTHHCKDIV